MSEFENINFCWSFLQFQAQLYEVCLTSNGTVHAARTTFIAEKKALLSMMLQCPTVSKTKFQHSVITTFFFARFSVKALSLTVL